MRLRLGRICGIMIHVDASWLVIFTLVTYSLRAGYFAVVFPDHTGAALWAMAIASSLLFFASVVAHELAHSVVARRHGIEVEGISLFLFGGVARMRREPSLPGSELRIALAGPVASIALAVAFGLLYWIRGGLAARDPLGAMSTYLALINVAVVAFNMVPGFPLDGGRVLRALVWGHTGSLARATRVAAAAGQGFGWLLIGSGFALALMGALFNGFWFVLVGWFLVDAARNAAAQTLSQCALSGVSLSQIIGAPPEPVSGEESIQTLVDTRLGVHAPDPVPVLRDGRIEGLVGVPEVRRFARALWPTTPLRAAMVPLTTHATAAAGQDSWATLVQMSEQKLEVMVVLAEDGGFQGTVTPQRLLDAGRRLARTVV